MMVFRSPQFIFQLDKEFLELWQLGAEALYEHADDIVLPTELILHLCIDHRHRQIHHLHRQQGGEWLLTGPTDLTWSKYKI